MPLEKDTDVFLRIVEELEKIKNLYSYSNNNYLYNSVVDMCITRILQMRDEESSSNQKQSNEE